MIQEVALGLLIMIVGGAAAMAIAVAVSPHEDDPQEKYRDKENGNETR